MIPINKAQCYVLHAAAVAADDAFHKALVKEYGRSKAGDMRYRYDLPPEIKKLALAFQLSMQAWHDSVSEMRKAEVKTYEQCSA